MANEVLHREIYGYCPIFTKGTLVIDKNQAFIHGVETATPNVFNCTIVFRVVTQGKTPSVEGSAQSTYEHYTVYSRACKITLTDNSYDIQDHTPLEGITQVSLKGSSIINIIDSDANSIEIKSRVKNLLDELDKLPFPDQYNMLDPTEIANNLSDGSIVTGTTSVPGSTRAMQEWQGTKPLDKLINILNANLNILSNNYSLKGDALVSAYTTLYQQTLGMAIELEKSRQQVYLALINFKAGLLKILSDYDNASATKASIKVQTKLYHTQMYGFKANNTNKLFSAQLDGAASAFSGGQLDSPPVTHSNSALMSTYEQVKTDMEMV